MKRFIGNFKTIHLKLFICCSIFIVLFMTSFSVIEAGATDFQPENVSISLPANYWTVETAFDTAENQYVFSDNMLFKRNNGLWSSHAVSPTGWMVYNMFVDRASIVHIVYGSGTNFYHAECPSSLPVGTDCPASEILGPFSNYTQNAASMVEDADGTLHAVYGSSQIFYKQRANGGSWTAPVAIYPPSGGLSPYAFAIRVDPDGQTLHLAGGNYYSPHKLYYGRRDSNGTWTFETAVQEGAVWGSIGMALDGSNPRICYGSSNGSYTYGPLKLASRDSAGVWTTEVLAAATTYGYGVDCDILNGTIYAVATVGEASGYSSSMDKRPLLVTKVLPSGTPVSQKFGNFPNERSDVAMTAGSRVSVAFTMGRYRLQTIADVTDNAPVVNAGSDQSVALNALVSLNGTATDTDGDLLAYTWRLTDPAGTISTLSGRTQTFTAALPGIYTAEMTASDGRGAQRTDTALVLVAGASDINLPSPVTVASDGGYYYVASAVDASGTQYIFSGGKLYKKTNSGWVSTSVSPAASQRPSIVISQSGMVHVFYEQTWSSERYTDHIFHAECVPNAAGQAPTCATSEDITTQPSGQTYYPLKGQSGAFGVVEDIDGTLHLVYAYFYGYWGLFYTSRTASGSWSPSVRVNPMTPAGGYMLVDDVSLRLDPDGRTLHAAYVNRDYFQAPSGVYYARRDANTTTWTNEMVDIDIYSYRVRLGLYGSTPRIIYAAPDYSLRLSTRQSGGHWMRETLNLPRSGGIQMLDAEVFGDKLYVLYSAGSGSSDDKRPAYVTKSLPFGPPSVKVIPDGQAWNWTQTPGVAVAPAPDGGVVYLTYNFNSTTLKTITLSNYPDSDGDGYTSNVDCIDSDPAINPGAPDIICNGIDNNCNGIADDGYVPSSTICGYGACVAIGQLNCVNGQSQDTCTRGTPQEEVCNGVDDDCDGQTDEGVLNTYYSDADNDTYGNISITTQACTQPLGYVSNSSDCNDSNATINPGATEICNGVDDNCNSQVDEGVQNTYYRDADIDTYGNVSVTTQACTAPSGYVSNSSDCNDSNGSINPGITEVCNSVDDNCNGQVDESVQNTYYRDSDSDTYGNVSVTTQACVQPSGYVTNSTDCNDSNSSIYPGAAEICNGVDDNCNTQVDEGVKTTYYRDADSDTYGNVSITTQACTQPLGYVSNSTDCNDNNASIKPGATEVCNGVDDNCNSQVDEGVKNTYFRDADTDTYGNPSVTTLACTAPSGYVSNSADCNDGSTSINPASPEVYNGVDDNCNAQIDEGVRPPVAYNQSVTTIEDTVVAIMLTGSDPDDDPLIFSVVNQPSSGTLSGVAPNLIYSPNGNFNGLDSFSFKVNDGLAYSNTATVSIMVSAVNDAPVVWDIPNISFDEDGSGTIPGTASLDSYVSDIETLDPFIAWTVIGGTNVTASINPDRTVTFTAVPNFNGQETLTFMATDTGDGTSGPIIASDTVVVTVTLMNDPPVLDPVGPKSVDENSLLTFIVGGNDQEGDILTFDAMGLPTGATFDQYTQTFSWTPDYTQAGPHFVTFTVSDGSLEDSELVNISVNNVNRLPVADAGTGETVHVDSVVTLYGSNSSDPDGDYPLTYSWSIISKPTGSTATLSDPTVVNTFFKADMIGDYVAELVVTDSLGLSSLTDSVVINTSNTLPLADAGPDQALIVRGTTVQLDGNQSYDPDGDIIYYSWTITQRPAGSTSVLSDPTSPTPTFVADVYGEYEFEIVVYDSWADSDPDSVIVSFTNVKPVANPGGNQSVIEGNTVSLNGSGSSDTNGDPLTYNWSFVSIPGGSTTTLTSTTSVTTSFVTDMPGTYVLSLVVNDGFVNSDPANVTITATSRQDEVIRVLTETNDTINSLNLNVFKNRNMVNALTNKINATLEMIDQGLYQDALDKLENDILGKTDGCATTGSPDRNDWIRDCEAQGHVYPLILQAIELLRGII